MRARGWLAVALVFGATVLAYAPSLGGELVWDDVILIRDNPALRSPAAAWHAAFGDFFQQAGGPQPASGYLRPVPTLLNAATWAVFGASPLPYRIENLALHLLAVALALALLLRLGFGPVAALAGAGVFALHPVQTEAVAFISGRTDLLAAVFGLGSALAYLRARRGGVGWALLALGLFVLAALSKEVAWALPAVLLVIELGSTERRWKLLGAYAAIVGAMAVPRLLGPGVGRMYFPASRLPVAAPNLLMAYASWLVWPLDLRALHDDLPVAVLSAATAGGVAIAALLGAVALRARAWPRAAFAAAWMGAFLLPVLHLLPLPALAAERYLYLPCLGLGALLGLAAERVPAWPRAAALAALGVAMLLGTGLRAADWHDEPALWGAEAAHPGASFKAWQNLAAALAERGRTDEAEAALTRAWQMRPGQPVVFRNLVRLGLRTNALSAEDRAAFARDALANPPDAARLAAWPPRLEQAGLAPLAAVVREMADQLAAPTR